MTRRRVPSRIWAAPGRKRSLLPPSVRLWIESTTWTAPGPRVSRPSVLRDLDEFNDWVWRILESIHQKEKR
jgi:hypothetical protein